MPYPLPRQDDIDAFQRDGYLVVRDAIDPADLHELERRCYEIVERKEQLASDWAWEKGVPRERRAFRIVQCSPTGQWPELADEPFRHWMRDYAAALMGKELVFSYDQFLGKPPGSDAPTYWHQDEAYWGRGLDDKGITCWMPFHDVDEAGGCMQFIRGGHLLGVLEHRQPEHVQSDLLYCDVDETDKVVCPLRLGDVTFHHSKTPHMTGPNRRNHWRRAVATHFKTPDADYSHHYPWRIIVIQRTGERYHAGKKAGENQAG